jgi:hypothetical protein
MRCSVYVRSFFLGNSKGKGSIVVSAVVLVNQLSFRLFVASVYDPLSILGKLFPYLGGSSSVVVYSPHLQVRVPCILSGVDLPRCIEVVSDLQTTLRADPRYLAPTVSESWLRQYQVSQFNARSDF